MWTEVDGSKRKPILYNILIFFFFNLQSCLYLFILDTLQGMWDLSSSVRDGTHASCIRRQSFNHWTTWEVPRASFLRMTSSMFFLPFILGLNKGERILYGAFQTSFNETPALSILNNRFKKSESLVTVLTDLIIQFKYLLII